jgi:hypothetical protein
MNRTQRIVVGCGLIAVAVGVHLLFCKWGWRNYYEDETGSLVDLSIVSLWEGMYLSARFGNAVLGVVAGLLLPCVMLAAAAMFLAAKSRPARIVERQCP